MDAILFDDALREASRPASGGLESLVARAKEGDAEAFDGIMEDTQARVVAVAWRLLGSRDLARDAAQEVFLRVFRSLRHFQAERDFHGWLHAIAVNVCRDLARQARRRERTFTRLDEAAEAEIPPRLHAAPRAESDLLLAERRARVRDALASLSRDQREAVVLRDLEGLTSEEVARVLGTTAGTVRSRLSAARRRLRVHLEGKRGAPAVAAAAGLLLLVAAIALRPSRPAAVHGTASIVRSRDAQAKAQAPYPSRKNPPDGLGSPSIARSGGARNLFPSKQEKLIGDESTLLVGRAPATVVSRIELRTSNPNVRIIWLVGPQPARPHETDSEDGI